MREDAVGIASRRRGLPWFPTAEKSPPASCRRGAFVSWTVRRATRRRCRPNYRSGEGHIIRCRSRRCWSTASPPVSTVLSHPSRNPPCIHPAALQFDPRRGHLFRFIPYPRRRLEPSSKQMQHFERPKESDIVQRRPCGDELLWGKQSVPIGGVIIPSQGGWQPRQAQAHSREVHHDPSAFLNAGAREAHSRHSMSSTRQ